MPIHHSNRVYISLKPETMRAMERLGQVMGKRVSTIISQMVEENAHSIDELANAISAARQAEVTAKKVWTSDMAKAIDQAHRLTAEAHDIISNLSDKATDERAARPRAERASAFVGGRS